MESIPQAPIKMPNWNQAPTPPEPIQAQPIQPEPQPTPQQTVNDFLADITTEAKPSADTIINEEGIKEPNPVNIEPVKETIDPAAAKNKTERLLKIRDQLQSRLLAFAARQPENHKSFELDKWEFDWLVDVYSEIVGEFGTIPVWVEIILVESCVMGPKIMAVLDSRRKEKIIEQQAAEISRLRNEKNGFTRNETPSPATGTSRPDAKKYWQVNAEGRFLYDINGNYLKDGEAKERPDLTPENYNQLVKYNGLERINKIFNIQ
jgi:hypothetical protein